MRVRDGKHDYICDAGQAVTLVNSIKCVEGISPCQVLRHTTAYMWRYEHDGC
jgi:hypothetical protein